jgi:hypothetical protein
MTNGEKLGNVEEEPQVSFMDHLRAEHQKVLDAQHEAAVAAEKARKAGEDFQAELNKLRGKTVVVTGPTVAEEALLQGGYEMIKNRRLVEGLDGNVVGIWARDRASEGYDRNKPVVYIRHQPADPRYRHHEVEVNLFDLQSIEIVDPPEVPAPQQTIGSVATESTVTVA